MFLGLLVILVLCPVWGKAQDTNSTITSDYTRIAQAQLKIIKSPISPLENRRFAASALLDLNVSDANEQLLKILADPADKQARLAVIESIADRDEPDPAFMQPLLCILINGDIELQTAAASALGRFRESSKSPEINKLPDILIEIAANKKRTINQRISAIAALGKMRQKKTVDAIIKIMEEAPINKNDQSEIESACAKSLQELTRANVGVNLNDWKKWWQQNRNKTTSQWLESQLDVVTNENRDLKKRLDQTEEVLISTIGQLYRLNSANDADRCKTIITYLTGTLPAERRAGLQLLTSLVSPKQPIPSELQPVIRDLIDDPDPTVRAECAKALAVSSDRKAVDQLLHQLEVETDPAVKQALLVAIGQLGDQTILSKLVQQLNSPLEPVSIGAGKAIATVFQNQKNLSRTLKDQTLQALLERYKLCGDDQQMLKQGLLATMTDTFVADARFLPLFKQELSNPNAELRRFAAKGIATLRDERLVDLLINQLNDSEPAVRAELATGIASLTSAPRAVETLLTKLSSNIEKDNQVRLTTWNAILTMTKHWPIDQQIRWANQMVLRSEPITREQTLALIDTLAAQITDQSAAWPAEQKINIMVEFGTFLLRTSKAEDAGKYFRQAISSAKQLSQEKPFDLADQLLGLLLQMSVSDSILTQYLNSLTSLLEQGQIQMILDRFIRWAENPANVRVAGRTCRHLSRDFLNSLTEPYRIKLNELAQKVELENQTTATNPS